MELNKGDRILFVDDRDGEFIEGKIADVAKINKSVKVEYLHQGEEPEWLTIDYLKKQKVEVLK